MTERARPGRGVDGEHEGGDPLEGGSSAEHSSFDAPAAFDGMARYGSLGLQFAGTILVLGALGYWADSAFGTLPWFLIAGILLGSVGGFISLLKKVPPARRRPPQDSRDAPPRHR
jgi:F0F1-type ATP synthase assembly protein I